VIYTEANAKTALCARIVAMSASVRFAPSLARHLQCPAAEVIASTLGAALNAYFGSNPLVRSYLLDDQGAVRKHVAIFHNRKLIVDRANLSDALADGDEIFIVQALSGG
jgi:molybdopterin converting factor small subunit